MNIDEAGKNQLRALRCEAQIDVTNNFQLGVRALQIFSSCADKAGAIKEIAKASAVSVQALQKAMHFAGWVKDEAKLKELMDRRDRFEWPLTWPHYLELLKTPDLAIRQEFLERALREALSPKALARAMRPPRRRADCRRLAPRNMQQWLSQVASMAERMNDKLVEFDGIVMRALQLVDKDPALRAQIVTKLTKASVELRDLSERARERAEKLVVILGSWKGSGQGAGASNLASEVCS